MSVLDLARADLRDFTPYASARKQAKAEGVLLNANESPFEPGEGELAGLNRYPEPQPQAVRQRLAEYYGVEDDQLLVTRGSDEGIDLLTRAFCAAGENAIVTMPPTFGMYKVAAGIQNARVIEVPLTPAPSFAIDSDAVLQACDASVRLVYVCSPNNPTGALAELAAIEQLCEGLRDRALVVIDEAYAEFAERAPGVSLLQRYDNVVVLRTLSKAWGLAGARCGALLARPEVVGLLGGIMAPYPLTLPAMRCVEKALAANCVGDKAVWLRKETAWLAEQLAQQPLALEVFPSAANFVLVRFDQSHRVMSQLLAAGVLIRDVSNQPGLENCLRVSTGTRSENQRLLEALSCVK
jgi:histidinol-phosphate aminotransferase